MTKWWGEIAFALNEIKSWQIGQRQIIVQRLAREWLVWNNEIKDESADNLELITLQDVSALSDMPLQRFLVTQTHDLLSVTPALADRPVIVRPSSALNILPGEQATLFVSSPLWLTFKNVGSIKPFN